MDVLKPLLISLTVAVLLAGCAETGVVDPAATSTTTETAVDEPEPVDTAGCQEAVNVLHTALQQRHEDLLFLMVAAPTAAIDELADLIGQVETLDDVNGRIKDANAALADCPGSEPLELIEPNDSSVPTSEPEPEPEPAEQVTKEDFEVTLFITSNECFNSAGSSVEFEPELAVEDPTNFPAVSGTLVYEVRAGEENLGTFSIEFADDGTYNYGEEFVSPDQCYDDGEITADVIRVRSR